MSTFIFTAKEGKQDFGSPHNEARFRNYLKESEGKLFRIERQITTRSLSQNSLYWLFLEVIEMETGNNAQELHEYFKRKYLKPIFIKVLGHEIKIPGSTKNMKKVAFGEYLNKISAETMIAIPDTDKYIKERNDAPLLVVDNEQKIHD